jgi:hypothetical protein
MSAHTDHDTEGESTYSHLVLCNIQVMHVGWPATALMNVIFTRSMYDNKFLIWVSTRIYNKIQEEMVLQVFLNGWPT